MSLTDKVSQDGEDLSMEDPLLLGHIIRTVGSRGARGESILQIFGQDYTREHIKDTLGLLCRREELIELYPKETPIEKQVLENAYYIRPI